MEWDEVKDWWLESHARSQVRELSKGAKFKPFEQSGPSTVSTYPLFNDSLCDKYLCQCLLHKNMRSINTNAMRVALRLMDQTHMLLGDLRVDGSARCRFVLLRLRWFIKSMPCPYIS